jgi:HK97 family phage major capsid protein
MLRFEARKALQALNRSTPENREQAEALFDSAFAALERGEHAQKLTVAARTTIYRHGGPHSWLMDQLTFAGSAKERVVRNANELRAAGRISEEELRALSSTAGAGLELTAPAFLQDQYIKLARSGRPYVEALTKHPLPEHTNEVEIPDITGGTSTAAQKDLGAVESVDAVTAEVKLPVITVTGQIDVAKQLFERAIPSLTDAVFFPDLAGDYLTKADIQAISGSGVAPNAQGVLGASEVNSVVWTQASPKLWELQAKIAKCISNTWTKRLLKPNLIAMHPNRWLWVCEQKDAQERPIVLPTQYTPADALDGEAPGEGPVGSWLGCEVVLDPNIPTNLGAGTNEDRVIVQRASDSWFLEEPQIRTKVYDLGTGVIRLQAIGYAGLTHSRYPKGISVISGTGLVAPVL